MYKNRGYDTLYQQWLQAKCNKDYALADTIRDDFERLHGLTIFAEGDMPIEEVTVKRMKASVWQKKYGNANVGDIIASKDSRVKQLYPDYRGTLDMGYHL
jgi:hypothetical protein